MDVDKVDEVDEVVNKRSGRWGGRFHDAFGEAAEDRVRSCAGKRAGGA